jgi:AcrR family transcriptional regulator
MRSKPKPAPTRNPKPRDASIAPRKAPRQERARVTVEALLDATARVLRESGYDGLTTNKVAVAAGVSVGSLYQYFPGKDALVIALLLRYAEHQHGAFQRALLHVADAPIPAVIDAVLEVLAAQQDSDPELAFILMNQLPRVGEMGQIIAYSEETLAVPLHAFLVARRADLPDLDLAATTFLLTHAIPPLLQRMRLTRPSKEKRRAVFQELRTMLVAYLNRGPARASR